MGFIISAVFVAALALALGLLMKGNASDSAEEAGQAARQAFSCGGMGCSACSFRGCSHFSGSASED